MSDSFETGIDAATAMRLSNELREWFTTRTRTPAEAFEVIWCFQAELVCMIEQPEHRKKLLAECRKGTKSWVDIILGLAMVSADREGRH